MSGCVARHSNLTKNIALFHPIAGLNPYRAALQVTNVAIFIVSVVERYLIAGVSWAEMLGFDLH